MNKQESPYSSLNIHGEDATFLTHKGLQKFWSTVVELYLNATPGDNATDNQNSTLYPFQHTSANTSKLLPNQQFVK